MKPTDQKPTPSAKPKSGSENIERALRDTDIPPEDLRAFQEDLKKNRKRLDGAGENPYDNLLDDEG